MEAITKATGGTNVYTISSETNISPPFVYHANSPIGIIDILGGGGPIGKGEQEGEHQHVKKTMMSVGGPVQVSGTDYYWHKGGSADYEAGWYAKDVYKQIIYNNVHPTVFREISVSGFLVGASTDIMPVIMDVVGGRAGEAIQPTDHPLELIAELILTGGTYRGVKAGVKGFASRAKNLNTWLKKPVVHLTPYDKLIIKELGGVTEMSSRIANAIKSGDLRIRVLDDNIFKKTYPNHQSAHAVAEPDMISIKASQAHNFQVHVHEGVHGLDFINKADDFLGPYVGKNQYGWEFRAFIYQEEFNIVSGRPTYFNNLEGLLQFIVNRYNNKK
jgi:hypothetical protein